MIKIDVTANAVTIDPAGAETLNGNLTHAIALPLTGIEFESDGTNLRTLDDSSAKVSAADIFTDFVVSGLTGADPGASLAMTIAAGVAYVIGRRVVKLAGAADLTRNYTVSKDTYADISHTGAITYTEVANGAGAPAVAANSLRLMKVVTNGSEITGVTDLRVLTPGVKDSAGTVRTVTSSSTANAIAQRDANGVLDNAVNMDTTLQHIIERFLGGTTTTGQIGTHGWSASLTGTAALNKSASLDDIRISTGATANSVGAIYLTSPFPLSAACRVKFRIQAGSLGRFKVGLKQTVWDGDRTDTEGVYFHTDSTTDGLWYAVTRNGSAETATSTGIAQSGSEVLLEIRYTTTSVEFYVNGVLKATHTTNIPTQAYTTQLFGLIENHTTASYTLIMLEMRGLNK